MGWVIATLSGGISRLFVVCLLAILTVLTVGISLVAHQTDTSPAPFADYMGLIGGELNTSFICKDISSVNEEMDAQAARKLCTLYPQDGMFSKINVLSGARIYRVYFTLRNRGLIVGDLARFWGRPHIERARRERIVLRWSAYGVVATVSPNRTFSYFLALAEVIFVRTPSAKYGAATR